MTLEKLLFIGASILPLFYVFCFWLSLIQQEKYSYELFKKLLCSNLGKRYLINFWLIVISPLFLASFGVFFDRGLEFIIFPVVYYLLLLYNIFVFGKIFRKRMFFPRMTLPIILLLLIFFGSMIGGGVYFIFEEEYWYVIYPIILGGILFMPLFFYIFLLIKGLFCKKLDEVVVNKNLDDE